ncbi:MAG: PAS domain-containing protein, partial [Candidatus Magasanikbacteria bacterium]|nr:PAS domain-containing protein [Candidatus Magasanikbacteria bacterium]
MEDSNKNLQECQNLFDSLPDPGGLLDSRGNFVLVTKAFENLVGRKKQDLIGENAFTTGLFNKDYEKIAFGNMKKWLLGKVVPPHDIELNVKNGKKIIAQTRFSVVNYHGKKSFLFILFDVTEQRKAEKLLIESEKKIRDILSSTTDIAWEVNAKGEIVYISGKVKEILGYEPKELIGKSPYNVMSPKEKIRTKKVFHDALVRMINITDFEGVVLTKNGKERIFLTNGIPVFDGNK